MKTTIITFRLSPIENKLLKKHAKQENKTRSDLLRELVSDLLTEKELT